MPTFGYLIPSFSSLRGSVNFPVITAAAAVSGLTRYAFALLVPLLPRKFLLLVLSETASVFGDWLFPIQKPHADSANLAPAERRFANPSSFVMFSRTCLLPGATTKLTFG